jgi:hypothetical protein
MSENYWPEYSPKLAPRRLPRPEQQDDPSTEASRSPNPSENPGETRTARLERVVRCLLRVGYRVEKAPDGVQFLLPL